MNIPKVGGASRLRHRENIYTSMDDGTNMKFPIEEWDKISEFFVKMFQGLGDVKTSDQVLQFASIEPYVATGISLSRKGRMAASMPLHNLDSTFNQVEFGESLESLTLVGNNSSYTYKIPRELLSIRHGTR